MPTRRADLVRPFSTDSFPPAAAGLAPAGSSLRASLRARAVPRRLDRRGPECYLARTNRKDAMRKGQTSADGVESTAAGGQVVEYVRRLIEARQLTPGDRLPPERDLA